MSNNIRPCEECLRDGVQDPEWLDDYDKCPDCGHQQEPKGDKDE